MNDAIEQVLRSTPWPDTAPAYARHTPLDAAVTDALRSPHIDSGLVLWTSTDATDMTHRYEWTQLLNAANQTLIIRRTHPLALLQVPPDLRLPAHAYTSGDHQELITAGHYARHLTHKLAAALRHQPASKDPHRFDILDGGPRASLWLKHNGAVRLFEYDRPSTPTARSRTIRRLLRLRSSTPSAIARRARLYHNCPLLASLLT
jgi:hypothetical protein